MDLFKIAVGVAVGLIDTGLETFDAEVLAKTKYFKATDIHRLAGLGGSLGAEYMGLLPRDLAETLEVAYAPLATKTVVELAKKAVAVPAGLRQTPPPPPSPPPPTPRGQVFLSPEEELRRKKAAGSFY